VSDRAALDEAIAALEAQRAVLGDTIVDTALRPLLERRAAIEKGSSFEQRKLVTILFSDLVDFTVLSQALDPEDVRAIVNRYFRRWSDHIEALGGVVEKFIGDAVMAVFGLYRSEEDDAQRAVRAAVAMNASLAELNSELEREHGVTLTMRVGIDTGDVVVSTLDDRSGAEFVVVGEAVNRAARLQVAAPAGGVLLSPDTFRHVRGSFALQRIEGCS
jgi:class 3 adenylate cyclase